MIGRLSGENGCRTASWKYLDDVTEVRDVSWEVIEHKPTTVNPDAG